MSPARLPLSRAAFARFCLNRANVAGAVLLVGLQVACARAQTPAPTTDAPGPGFDDVLRSLNLKARESKTPDFVVKSRPAPGSMQFIPVGTPHPRRAVKVLTPAEVTATEAELDAARTQQQRRAGLKPQPVPEKTRKPAVKTIR